MIISNSVDTNKNQTVRKLIENGIYSNMFSNTSSHANNVNNNNNQILDNLNNRVIQNQSYRDFYVGLTLALLSSFFIGSSFILKKKGLLKLCGSSSLSTGKRAAQGGYGYLKEWLWWSGLLTMGVGELCNFAAYGFVPATLVTPLGALSVLISAIMSAYFLDEKLNTIGKIGCLLTAIGSTVMVIHAPKEGEVKTVRELLYRIQDAEFIIFTILSIIALLVLIFVLVPRYGNTNVLIYILICSILGSFTVMSCKGLSLGIKEIFLNRPSVSFVYTYLFAILVIVCIVIQMNYLNKSLDIFNTPIVTTVYYVLFTLFVMIASAILFKELLNVSFQDFVGCMCGFSTIICALFLIQFFKTTNDQNDCSTKLEKYDPNSNNNNYDNNILNLILNNPKNVKLNNDLVTQDNYLMNEMNNENELKQTSFDIPKQKFISDMSNSNIDLEQTKKVNQSPSDFIQSVTIFKTAKINDNINSINNNNNTNIADKKEPAKPTSIIKKLTSNYNIYKNLQNNYIFNKFKTNSSSGYNYNKLTSDETYDFREDEDEINHSNHNSNNNNNNKNLDDLISQKNNKKYHLIENSNNINNNKSDFDLKYKLSNKNRKPVSKRESRNVSFDEKLFAKEDSGAESDEANATSTSLIILKS